MRNAIIYVEVIKEEGGDIMLTREEQEMMMREFEEFQKNIFYEVIKDRVIADVERAYEDGMTVDEAIKTVVQNWANDVYTMIKEYIENEEVD